MEQDDPPEEGEVDSTFVVLAIGLVGILVVGKIFPIDTLVPAIRIVCSCYFFSLATILEDL